MILCLLVMLVASLGVRAQGYEVEGNMPVWYAKMKEKMSFPLAYENAGVEDFEAWKVLARQTVWEEMGILPERAREYDVEVVATEKRDGYEARKIRFNVSEWSRVPAYLLVPEGEGRHPAVLVLHDHGAHFTIGKEKMVRPFGVSEEVLADAESWVGKCYDGEFVGDYLARSGYVVLAVDALFWGERGRKEGASYDVQQALAGNFLQMGGSWGGLICADDVRSAEFLASLPFVDAGKVATLGHSMGGYRAWMTSALTDVVSVSVGVCWFGTTEGLMTMTNNQNKGGSAYSMIIPGLRRYMDYPHVAALACPKPSLFFNGLRDKLFPKETVEAGYVILRKTWEREGAAERLVTKFWDEKHYFNKEMQREALEFLDKWLKR